MVDSYVGFWFHCSPNPGCERFTDAGRFTQSLAAEYLDDALLGEAVLSRWEPIFERLVQSTRQERLVIVLDEFQYIGKSSPAFLSVFQRIWDQCLCKANVMVVLCGSLISMMMSQTLSYDSPIYGRRTAQLRLRPVCFEYYADFFSKDMARDQLVSYYSVTGGIPKYIEMFPPYRDWETDRKSVV